MNPIRPLVIHNLLPNEIMGVIFEEHSKLEWRAPAIDGRVCRIWRQIVLNTPLAWISLEISAEHPPRTTELREWLHRSGSAPLYIRVNKKTTFGNGLYRPPWYDLLRGYHTRIASLRLPVGDPFFFGMRDFPCLRVLEINRWSPVGSLSCPVQWGSMPELRSLRLAPKGNSTLQLQWSDLTQLEALSLYSIRLTSPPQHPQSLTTLVLDRVSVEGISSPMAFPSLTYLSLYGVIGLKRYINAPCLVTYHEGWSEESFSSPLPSLVEYGLLYSCFNDANLAGWHCSFPNVLRLSIYADQPIVISLLHSLSRDPHSLPALQTISVRSPSVIFTEEEKASIKDLVRVRGEACQMDVMLYLDTKRPFHNPMFFGEVRNCLSNVFECLMQILEPRICFLKVIGSEPARARTKEVL
jgi:hypothetical protein